MHRWGKGGKYFYPGVKVIKLSQRHRQLLANRGIRQLYIHFCTLTVSREDVRAFMAERPEYTKANRFKDIVVKVYI